MALFRFPGDRWLGEWRRFAILFALVALLFLTLALWLYGAERGRIARQQFELLRDLQLDGVAELEKWRAERTDEIRRFAEHRSYLRAMTAFLRGREDPLWPTVVESFELLLTRQHYEAIYLRAPTGEMRFIAGRGLRRGERGAIRPVAGGWPRFHAVGAGADMRIRLEAPLRGADGALLGVIGFQLIPQEDFRGALISTITISGAPVELLLVEEGRVVAPDPGRHPAASLTGARPLRDGFVAATDELGRPVVAGSHALEGTPWALLMRVDESAFSAAAQRLNFWTALLLLAFLGTIALLAYLAWRRAEAQHKLRELNRQRELKLVESRFDYLAKYANDAIILASHARRVLEVNDKAVALYGYSREEFRGMDIVAMRAPQAAADYDHDWEAIEREPSVVYETVHRSKEGREFPVEVSARRIEIEGECYIQGIIRDISERKQAEKRERQQKDLYAALSRANEAIARHYTPEALLPEICRIAVETTGYAKAYVSMLDEQGAPHVKASHGELARVKGDDRLEEAARQTEGPLMRALRGGEPAVANDYTADPRTAAAHQEALRHGINSAAAFPLRRAGQVVGAFGVLSRERHGFDAEQLRLLQDLALDISLALENYARDQQRRAAEQLTRESEARHRALFENMGSGVIVLVRGPAGGFLVKDINAAAERMEGMQRKDVIGRSLDLLFPWASHCLAPAAEAVWRSGKAQEIPTHCHPQDHHGWRESYVYRLPTEELVAVVNDVTERVVAAEALRKSEERLALVLEGTDEAYWDFNFESGEVYYSERFARMFGYRAEELGSGLDSWQKLVHPNDLIGVQRLLADHLAGKTVEFVSDHRMRHRTRGYLWVRGRGRVVRRGVDGRPLRMSGTHTDITAQRTYEEYLRLWATVFEHSREAIMVTDAQRRIVSVNRAFTEITGYSLEEMRGSKPGVLSSGVHDRAFYQTMWAAIEQTGHWQGEIRDRRKSGEIIPMWTAITAVKDGEGVVQNYIAISSDISERKEAEERIRYLAYHDALTGLPNRSLFTDRLNFSLAHAQRLGLRAAVMFLDLDRFKHVNDSLGHPTGDRLLIAVAERLRECVRKEDTVGRQGGDEFLVLLADLHQPQEAIGVTRKIMEELRRPHLFDGVELRVTASVGIAIHPEDGADGDTLIRNADAAMYEAKERGRDNFQFFTEELNRRARTRLTVETALRRAVDEGDFVLHYQPQVELGSGRVVGAEALLRWRREGALVAPKEFLPLAEEAGLMVPIGEWVIREVCRQRARWETEGMPALRIGVNVSASQFRGKDWAERMRAALGHCAADGLELELTEGVLMQEAESGVATLRALKEMGVALALDDFGTGFSNLSYLRHFPIDRLKVDQSFVHDLGSDPIDRAVTGAIIRLARGLGIRVVAEGVEAEEEMTLLREQHCDEVQGNFVAPPLAADQLSAWWRRRLSGASPGLQ